MQRPHFIHWISLTAVMCLSACSGLLESPRETDRTFMLQPLQASGAALAAPVDETFVLKLRVVPGLDTNRLVTISDSAELNHFAAARWPDNLPELSQSLIERSLRAQGWLATEHEASESTRTECVLKLEIEKFHTSLGPAGQPSGVQIQWDGYYSCDAASLPVRVSEQVPVGQKDIFGVVMAYQQGFDLAMQSTIRQMKVRKSDQ